MSNRKFLGIGQLGRRLTLAFISVALAAIAVLGLISAKTTATAITKLTTHQEQSLALALSVAAGATHSDGGWASDDLVPVFKLVARDHAGAQVRDAAGRVVKSSPSFGALPRAGQLTEPIRADGRRVGSVIVRFGDDGLGGVPRAFEAQRWRARFIAASIAALIALLVSLVMARTISRPLELMLEAVRARGAGSRSVRIRRVRGVGVIRELLESFNQASNAIDRQDRLRRNLVADVAHELRTPVAVLQATNEAMLDGVTDPTPENLQSLNEEVLRLARMVEDLQRLSAAEAAALQMTLAPHDLAGVVAGAVCPFRGSFAAAGVSLTERLREVHVLCDPARIREVVSNLLSNALKFTPPGGSVVLDTGPDETGRARLRVSDTGIGIKAKELPHVTERFFRGMRSPEIAAGSGIGLTIVTELVDAHRGQFEMASEPGQGTQMTVTLPALDPAEARRLALLRSAARSPSR